jgi:hypothetical protein
MANDIKINSGVQTYRFFDEEDNLITSFSINPADISLLTRCEETQEFFENNKLEDAKTAKEMLEVNNAIEKQIDYLLGVETTIFRKPLTATTVMPDGRIFAELILDTVLEHIKPELEKRAKAKKERLDKYVAKYNK